MKTSPRTFPEMRCDRGCGECCGIVPTSRVEADAVRDYAAANGIKPVAQGTTCPWYQNGGCAVYPARPFICKAYGHVEAMRCPRGYNTNIPPRREADLMRAYVLETNKHGDALLHEAVYSTEELLSIVEAAFSLTTPITIGGDEYQKPDPKAYSGGRTIKLLGLGLKSHLFVDQNTGEVT